MASGEDPSFILVVLTIPVSRIQAHTQPPLSSMLSLVYCPYSSACAQFLEQCQTMPSCPGTQSVFDNGRCFFDCSGCQCKSALPTCSLARRPSGVGRVEMTVQCC
eukprot:299578_1